MIGAFSAPLLLCYVARYRPHPALVGARAAAAALAHAGCPAPAGTRVARRPLRPVDTTASLPGLSALAVGATHTDAHATAAAVVRRLPGAADAGLALGRAGVVRGRRHCLPAFASTGCTCCPEHDAMARPGACHFRTGLGRAATPPAGHARVCVHLRARLRRHSTEPVCGQRAGTGPGRTHSRHPARPGQDRPLAHGLGRCRGHWHGGGRVCRLQTAVASHLVRRALPLPPPPAPLSALLSPAHSPCKPTTC